MNYCRSTLLVSPPLGLLERCRSARPFIQVTYNLTLRNETDHFRRKGVLVLIQQGRRLRDLFSEWCVIRSAPRERGFPDADEMRTFKEYPLENVALASNAESPGPIAVLKDRLIVVAQIQPGTCDGSVLSTRHPATLTQQGVDARDLMEWCPVRSLMARRISPCLNLDCDKLSGGLW